MEKCFSLLLPRRFLVNSALQLPFVTYIKLHFSHFLLTVSHIRRLPYASPQSRLSQFSAQALAILLPVIRLPELDDYITSEPRHLAALDEHLSSFQPSSRLYAYIRCAESHIVKFQHDIQQSRSFRHCCNCYGRPSRISYLC
jgi:hypothetical protein